MMSVQIVKNKLKFLMKLLKKVFKIYKFSLVEQIQDP